MLLPGTSRRLTFRTLSESEALSLPISFEEQGGTSVMWVLHVCRSANGSQTGTDLYCHHTWEPEEGHIGFNEGLPTPVSWPHHWLVMDVPNNILNYWVYYYHYSITLCYYNTNISKYMACFPVILSQPLAVCSSESPEPEVIPFVFYNPR